MKNTETKKINLNTELKEIYFYNNLSEEFAQNYSASGSGYICDIISEFADSYVDIYYSDRAKWFAENWSLVDDAIAELGSSGSIMQDIAAAQFLENERAIYKDLEDIIKYLSLQYLIDNNIAELSEADFETLENEIAAIDSNDRIDAIADLLNDLFINKADTEEEDQ